MKKIMMVLSVLLISTLAHANLQLEQASKLCVKPLVLTKTADGFCCSKPKETAGSPKCPIWTITKYPVPENACNKIGLYIPNDVCCLCPTKPVVMNALDCKTKGGNPLTPDLCCLK